MLIKRLLDYENIPLKDLERYAFLFALGNTCGTSTEKGHDLVNICSTLNAAALTFMPPLEQSALP